MGDDGFLVVGITPPEPFESESGRITDLLDSGEIDIVHLRHPEADVCDILKILTGIPAKLRGRITLHDHFGDIPPEYVGGYHLNSRNPSPPASAAETGHRISRSCHSLQEISNCSGLTYATLSPIFNSISKAGYLSNFSENDLAEAIAVAKTAEVPLIALGGVTPERFGTLRDIGFAGAAMLGALWTLKNYDKSIRISS